MPAVALTDHANMMGAFHFVKEVKAHNQGHSRGKQLTHLKVRNQLKRNNDPLLAVNFLFVRIIPIKMSRIMGIR